MTDTTIANTSTPIRPDGMTDVQWQDIEWGFTFAEGTSQRRLARRSLENWNTMLTAAQQRDTLINNHRETNAALNATITKQARHLEVIAEELLAEARRRDWCSEYDDYADRVNDRLGEEVLHKCARNYEAKFMVSVIVNARTEDQAGEWAENEVDRLLGRGSFIGFNTSCESVEEAED